MWILILTMLSRCYSIHSSRYVYVYAGLVPSISEAGKEGERIFVPSFALHHERGDEAESVLNRRW